MVDGFPGGGLGLHAHRGVRPVRAELHRVADQVLPDLPDQPGIAGRIGQLAHVDRGPAARMAVAQVSHDRFRQRGHVDGHVLGVFPAHAGQRQQALDEVAHPLGVAPDVAQQGLAVLVELRGVVIEQDLAVAMDRAQRRPQVMRHGVAEALKFLVGAQKIGGALLDPVLQLGRAAPQRGGLAGHRFLGPPALADIPPGSHDPVAELHDPEVESPGHLPPSVDVLVVGVLPGERLAGLGHPDVVGEQPGGHRPGEQLRDGVPDRLLPGPLVQAASRVVDVLIAEVRDGAGAIVDRREDSEPVRQRPPLRSGIAPRWPAAPLPSARGRKRPRTR